MLQRVFPWCVGGLSFGLVVSLALWLMFSLYIRPLAPSYRGGGMDQVLVASMVESGINNPEVQNIIKNQVVIYLKSSEGRARMAEVFKSPELVKALSENVKSPELRAAILELMQIPEFRRAVIDIVKDTPEMKLLTTIASAITLDENDGKSAETSDKSPALLR
ncbi:MAG: hypothetical protein N2491_03680 [Negativicutes bacterium]|nr:hypothetical protein [Negativicutes bacterium]